MIWLMCVQLCLRQDVDAGIASGCLTDWDDYFRPRSAPAAATATGAPEKVVILSSGWAALEALRKCARPGRDVVVVSPRPHFLYTPLLASLAVGIITLRSACEPLRALVERAAGRADSATYVWAHAHEVDLENRTVVSATDTEGDGSQIELSYDKLVVTVGAQQN